MMLYIAIFALSKKGNLSKYGVMEILNFKVSQHAVASKKQENSKELFLFATEQLQKGAYEYCIELYQHLCTRYSDMESSCQYQIGMARFFLGEYEQAVECYLAAYGQGVNVETIEDDIWEAYEMLYKETQNIAYIIQYMEYCPCGRYVKEAKKIVSVHHSVNTI
jgi:tetratricopeptide (TPR) repeat protein